MNMTNEQIQALKGNQVIEPYYLVECGNCAEIYPSNKLAGGCQIADTGDYGSCYCPHCDAGDEYEDLGNNAAEAWNYQQKRIDALLAEREADKALIAEQAKRIGFLKEQLSQLANFNPDWDMLEAARDSLREHMAELTAANKRNAETDDELCKLLPGVQYMDPPDGGSVTPLEQVSRMVADYRQQIAELSAGWGNCQRTMGVYCHAYAEAKSYISDALQARALTVKLPPTMYTEFEGDDYCREVAVLDKQQVIDALSAAGITLKVGGEDATNA